MRITRSQWAASSSNAARDRLQGLSTSARREFPVCGDGCPSHVVRSCHRQCPDVPLALSDAPDDLPLEAKIAPLVYELHRLDGIQPCWSCEGHEQSGELWQIPQVWFYAATQQHARVLSDAVTSLRIKGDVDNDWEVALTFSGPDNPDTTFTLRPAWRQTSPALASLQSDVSVIARVIVPCCQSTADNLRTRLA